MLAWKNALNVDDHEQKELVEKDREEHEQKNDKKKMEPLTIPEYQKKMIGAFDTYIKYVPDAPELVTIKYRKARIYYEYNHFDEALEAVRGHRQQAPEARAGGLLGEPAARLAERAGQDARRSSKYVDKFLEMPELMKDPEFGKQMISLKSDSYDMEGMVYEKQRNFKECGRSMLAAAEALPDHPKHAERLWNAGQCFQNAHLVGQALKARLQLIKDAPERSAGAEGAVPHRRRLSPAGLLLEGGRVLRGLRQQVPGREEGDGRARQRDDVPHRPRRERARRSRTWTRS